MKTVQLKKDSNIEVEVLKEMSHPNIVLYFHSFKASSPYMEVKNASRQIIAC